MGRKKKVSVTYLRNRKFLVNTHSPCRMLVLLRFLVAGWEICSVAVYQCKAGGEGCLLPLTYGTSYLTALAPFVSRSCSPLPSDFWGKTKRR